MLIGLVLGAINSPTCGVLSGGTVGEKLTGRLPLPNIESWPFAYAHSIVSDVSRMNIEECQCLLTLSFIRSRNCLFTGFSFNRFITTANRRRLRSMQSVRRETGQARWRERACDLKVSRCSITNTLLGSSVCEPKGLRYEMPGFG